MQNFLILRELQTEFLKFKIHFAKISYKEFLIKKLSVSRKFFKHISGTVHLRLAPKIMYHYVLPIVLSTRSAMILYYQKPSKKDFWKHIENFSLEK